jgi:hypothetical protein
MDAVTVFELSGLQQMMDFFRNIFPWLTLLLLLITAVGVALGEKRRRKLVLARSVEQERIESMENISAAERARLLRAAAPLPDVREAYPLPDLPLRLVSSFSKVFGLLKILLLSGFIFSCARLAANPGASRDGTYAGVMLLLVAVMIGLAVGQIAASAQVTRGSNKARRFLLFLAVIEFGGAVRVPGMPFEALWLIILFAMSAYTVWVLLLRTKAQSAVMHAFAPTRVWQKGTVLALCLFSWVCCEQLKLNTTASNQRLESNSSITENHGITLPITRVVLQAGDDSDDTRQLMDLLADAFDVPVERVAFGAVPFGRMSTDALFLLISKVVDERNKRPRRDGGEKIWRAMAKENPEMAGLVGQTSLDHKIGFNIHTPFSSEFFAAQGHSMLRHMSSPSIRLTQSAEYSGKSRAEILEDIAAAVAKTFNQSMRQRKDKALLSALPDALMVEPEPLPMPELDAMENAVHEAGYFAPEQQIQLYRLNDFSMENYTAVSNQLVAAGWKHAWDGRFEKGHERISLRGNARYAGQDSLPYLHLMHAKWTGVELPESFAVDFCREHYGDFIEVFQTKTVPEEVLYTATLDYLKTPNLTAPELQCVYERLDDVKPLAAVRPDVLLRFARELRNEPLNEWTFELYKQLGKALSVDHAENAGVYDSIRALYGEQMLHLQLERHTNGMQRATATVTGAERPLLVTMSKMADDAAAGSEFVPFYFVGWVEKLEDGTWKSHSGTPDGGSCAEGAELEARYLIIRDFLSDSHGSAYGAAPNLPWLEQSTRPGDLSMMYEFSPQTAAMNVTVLLNDGQLKAVPESEAASDLNLSHELDGRYLLDGKRLTKDELADALLNQTEPAE